MTMIMYFFANHLIIEVRPRSMSKIVQGICYKHFKCPSKFDVRNLSLSRANFFAKGKVNLNMDEGDVLRKCGLLPPPLTNDKHKGQAGRVGVFGGSLDYTGAPYFSSISSLRVGADLVYVFTTKDAAPVIKSYSPELIVHPYLDDADADQKIEPWLERLHVAVIGPGLGRAASTFVVVEKVISMCRARKIPLVIDADGLFLISEKPDILRDYPNKVVLTPNKMEFARLVGSNGEGNKTDQAKHAFDICRNLTLVCKGHEDEIFSASRYVKLSKGGSGRRCGGQGDLLSGSLGTFLVWALQRSDIEDEEKAIVAGYAACKLTRSCNEVAFKDRGRSMVCSDMIEKIHNVFEEHFELK